MKFSCERCGKRYATAEEPTPGRIYKLKCKACGNLIVVRPGSSKAAAPSSAPSRTAPARAAEGLPAGIPRPDPPREVPPPLRAAAHGAAESAPAPRRDLDSTSLISMSGEVGAPEEEFKPPPVDTGYVDLFAGDVRGGETSSEDPSAAPADDPFLAAARASLPEGFGMGGQAGPDLFLPAGGSPDPFAEVEPVREPPAPRPHPATVRAPEAEPVPAVSSGAARPRRPVLLAVLLGMGVGLVAVIALLVFTWSEPKALRAAPSPVSSRPAPARADPSPEPEPRVPASVANPASSPKEARASPNPEPRREEPKPRRKEPRVAQAPNAEQERSPLPVPPPPPEPPAAVSKPKEQRASLPDLEGTLTPEVVNKVLAENRKAFMACIAQAANSPGVSADRRKVQLRLTINPNGVVTSPALDDAVLDSTELGGCLKDAARAMVFPRYKGNPFDAQIPLVLR